MFIYHIFDDNNTINFKNKLYKTPCNILVSDPIDLKILQIELCKKNIKNIKVKKTNKKFRRSNKFTLANPNGSITLGATIKG